MIQRLIFVFFLSSFLSSASAKGLICSEVFVKKYDKYYSVTIQKIPLQWRQFLRNKLAIFQNHIFLSLKAPGLQVVPRLNIENLGQHKLEYEKLLSELENGKSLKLEDFPIPITNEAKLAFIEVLAKNKWSHLTKDPLMLKEWQLQKEKKIVKILSRIDFKKTISLERLKTVIDELYIVSNSIPQLKGSNIKERAENRDEYRNQIIRLRWEKAVLKNGLISTLENLNLFQTKKASKTRAWVEFSGKGFKKLFGLGINFSTVMYLFFPNHIPVALDRLNSPRTESILQKQIKKVEEVGFDQAFMEFTQNVERAAQWSSNYQLAKSIHLKAFVFVVLLHSVEVFVPLHPTLIYTMKGRQGLYEVLISDIKREYVESNGVDPSPQLLNYFREGYVDYPLYRLLHRTEKVLDQ